MVRPAFAGALTEAFAIAVVETQRVMLIAMSKERKTTWVLMMRPRVRECSEVE